MTPTPGHGTQRRRVPTIREVAKRSGVSVTTVSNVLNGRTHRMTPDTLTRIKAVMGEVGFSPSRSARHLRLPQTTTIGLLVPNVANPFWGSFAQKIEAVATESDIQVLLCNTDRDADRELRYFEQLWGDGVRHAIVGSSLPSVDHLREVIARGLRVIAFDRTAAPDEDPAIINVSVDNFGGSKLAMQHLLELGHRHIGLVPLPGDTVSRRARLAGARAAIADSGTDAQLHVWSGRVQGTGRFGDADQARIGRVGAAELMDDHPGLTAIMAINDISAIGCLAAVRDAGRHVPDDVSIVGFDDIPLAALMDPPLTTVSQPLDLFARYALEAVRQETPPPPPELPFQFVARASTGPVPVRAA